MIEGENYKVVDECMEEDDVPSQKQDNTVESPAKPEQTDAVEKPAEETKTDSTVDVEETKSCDVTNNVEESTEDAKAEEQGGDNKEDTTQPTGTSIDFTADITLEQLDTQKEITDEEVMNHLDEIENIVLDPAAFDVPCEKQQEEPMDTSNEVTEVAKEETTIKGEPDDDVIIVEDVPAKKEVEVDNSWYEKKLAEKEATIKERLSKLARVLEFSYPSYKKWLEVTEKLYGTPMCKLEPARRCPLDKPYTNRWKFICSRKNIEESAKEADSADASTNKSAQTVWRLEPTGAWGVNINNDSEFPPFVLRAVKVFEDFLQTTEQPAIEESMPPAENFTEDVSIDMEQKKDGDNEGKQQWLWLLVRCNSMDELMLFATGKNISRHTMDRLKQVYESGPGKDCNVKSLYCKSVNKCDETTITNTTFLVGSEALDEIVGGIKVQLAPKTNFWSNAAGAENVANTVAHLLTPTVGTTILEIGCGIGLIGLLMASKCERVIGVDSQSEVEEAEMTCELNNIKNASFIMGSPTEVTQKINAAAKSCKTYAIINANTSIGRALEVMTCLRKINSIRRLVMITTLTKQSVRAILELARPDRNIGNPFVPIRACVVDTLPVGPHFEVVILMQRRALHQLTQPWMQKALAKADKLDNTSAQEKTAPNEPAKKGTPDQTRKLADKPPMKFTPQKGLKSPVVPIKPSPGKFVENLTPKAKFKGKRVHTPEAAEGPPKKFPRKADKFKPWRSDVPDAPLPLKKEWTPDSPVLRVNPLYEKKLRENKDVGDLRERLTSNRVDPDIVQKVKEHQVLLEIAKEKLSGPAPTVDITTAKQLQSMLNMVLEQTNKLQSQLPRSVWDRIAPPANAELAAPKIEQEDPLLKGRFVQETGAQDTLITIPNKKFESTEPEVKPFQKRKYHNLPPLEPNLVMPVARAVPEKSAGRFGKQLQQQQQQQQQQQGNTWNRNKPFQKNRWSDIGDTRKPTPLLRSQSSPMKHRISPSRRFSPKRAVQGSPMRRISPSARQTSPNWRPTSPFRPRESAMIMTGPSIGRPGRPSPPLPRQMSPMRLRASPPAPMGRSMSPPRSFGSRVSPQPSMRRHVSPPPPGGMRRQMSPPGGMRRQLSPPGMRRQLSPPGMRRQMSPPLGMRRQMSPPPGMTRRMSPPPGMTRRMSPPPGMTRRMSPPPGMRRQMSPPRREPVPLMRLSLLQERAPSPFALSGRPLSPQQRQQSPPRRPASPPRRFADEWDIPSRGAVEQSVWPRLGDRSTDDVWRDGRRSSGGGTWEQQPPGGERYRAPVNQDNWDIENASRDGPWTGGGGGDAWSNKPPAGKVNAKDMWVQGSDGSNKWSSGPINSGPSGDNWNIRGKESFGAREEPWSDKNKQRWETSQSQEIWIQGDKEDWSDLPEDARDPWGDDGNVGLKERWLKFDNPSASSNWGRDKDKGDSWQNKGPQPGASKPQWQQNASQKPGNARWVQRNNNTAKKVPPLSGWQGATTTGTWRQVPKFNFSMQRVFGDANQFKERR